MNQINLEKLLQTASALKTDSSSLKLAIAEIYSGQLQQLSDGKAQLQLTTAQGKVFIALPASIPPALYGQVQVKVDVTADNRVQLTLTSTAALPVKIEIPTQQAQQLLLHLPLTNTSRPVQQPLVAPQRNTSTAVLSQPIQLLQQANSAYLQLAQQQPLKLPADMSAAITTLQQQSSKPLQASLVLPSNSTQLQLHVISFPTQHRVQIQSQPLPGNITNHHIDKTASQTPQSLNQAAITPDSNKAVATPAALAHVSNSSPTTLSQWPLKPAEQQQLLQQLSRLLTITPVTVEVKQGRFELAGQNFQLPPLQAASSGQYQLQLQPQQQQWQLLLQAPQQKANVAVALQDFSRPVQLVAATTTPTMTVTLPQQPSYRLPQQQLSQAWRNLLPLLPASPSPLASLPELPAPVREILDLVRHSQPDISKPVSAEQVASQLNSLLQFQPLQPQPNLQTNSGTLAAVLQLLMGQLGQFSNRMPANSPSAANSKLMQLISQLDPAQSSLLLRQLASHSTTMQHAQLATLDTPAQQLQQWLFQLPLQQNGQSIFSQLQIEQRQADGKNADEKQTQWQLTMKFNLQQYGQLLVVAKLQQQELKLQFYTDNAQAQHTAERFMPVLKDRCIMQGIKVVSAECQQGKIPETLLPRSNSLVAIKV